MTSRGYTTDHSTARALAYGLGWFSIALGVGELMGARRIKEGIGAPSATVFRAYGLREIATGLAILASPEPNKMVWARVAGDLLDLVTLAPTLSPSNQKQGAATGAVAFVAGATLLDIAAASLDGSRSQFREPLRLEEHRQAAE